MIKIKKLKEFPMYGYLTSMYGHNCYDVFYKDGDSIYQWDTFMTTGAFHKCVMYSEHTLISEINLDLLSGRSQLFYSESPIYLVNGYLAKRLYFKSISKFPDNIILIRNGNQIGDCYYKAMNGKLMVRYYKDSNMWLQSQYSIKDIMDNLCQADYNPNSNTEVYEILKEFV